MMVDAKDPDPPPTRPPAGTTSYGAAGWLLAGVTGMVCAVTIAVAGPLTGMTAVTIPVMAGCATMLAFAPWRRVVAWRSTRADLARLAEVARRSIDEQRPVDLQAIAKRTDELGELGRTIERVLEQAITNRRATERLQRDMGENIKRETRRQTIRLKKEALTDPLTGLANRRALPQQIGEMADRWDPGDPVVAMAVDMDMFKPVNDMLGHDTGDACLRFLGDLLRSSVRREDCAIRLGGDEFVVLMPGQTLAGSETMAQRLCSLFRQMPWSHTAVPRPTLSVGLATTTFGQLDDGAELLRCADEALYTSKRLGRARISIYDAGARTSTSTSTRTSTRTRPSSRSLTTGSR